MQITNNIYWIGVNDRQKHLFEGLWPLPNGVSYNSYLVKDEKTALIDTVDLCFYETYLKKIRTIIGNEGTIDYLIVNHMEPDHAGSIRLIRREFPNIQIVGNKKTLEFIKGYHGICDNTIEIKDAESLSLGSNTLRFYLTPMVHWPETMVTFCEEQRVLFSGDAFGCFGTLDGGVIDSQMNLDKYWSEMRRYYSNIVGKYGSPVQKALEKLGALELNYICSTHGPVWNEEILRVIGAYDQWSRYESEQGVVIAYGTMYGNTEQMAEAIAEGVVAAGIKNVVLHNLSKSDPSYVLSDIFQYQGLIIGSPTYSNELYPQVKSLLDKIETRDIKKRFFAYFGSYTWAGAAVRNLASFAERMKWETVAPSVENKQAPTDVILQECYDLGYAMGSKLLQE